MRLLFFASAVTALLFTGCSQQKVETKNSVLMSYNNTEVEQWGNLYNIRKDANAHSGNSVSFINSEAIYSVSYSNTIEAISKTKLDSVVFTYWAFLKNDQAQAKTVFSIDDKTSGKNVSWAGNPSKEKVKEYNKWVEIKETFKFPSNVDPKYTLSLYVLNTSKEEILLDDFKVEFY